ncbi:MAG: hypothetical protein E7610_08670 [Ruminococcaceae bacterium]|nr:hypothetical protein [Oscillospiraceae bacterium]
MNPKKRNSRGSDTPSRRTMTEWLAVRLDAPADVLDGGIRLDMRGRNTLTVHGCTRIMDFSPCEISLCLGGSCTLTVEGQRLICSSYLAGAVGIEGLICSIRFCDGEVTE